jgi:hypothetical protein
MEFYSTLLNISGLHSSGSLATWNEESFEIVFVAAVDVIFSVRYPKPVSKITLFYYIK